MNLPDSFGNLIQRELAKTWLKNGIVALAIAGIYSIILVLLRTPYLTRLISNKEIFKAALVVHVNLSVLAWLISIASSIWSLNGKFKNFNKLYSMLCLSSLVLMSISPLFGQDPVMNNYIPMLDNVVFISGLSLFGISNLLYALTIVLNIPSLDEFKICNVCIIIRIAAITSAIIYFSVWFCFILSYLELKRVILTIPLSIDFYYELLYWSGGHLLQFLYTQILMIVWIILFQKLKNEDLKFKKIYLILLGFNLIQALSALIGHYKYDIISAEFKEYFTMHMKYSGGIAPVICVLLLILETKFWHRIRSSSYISASLICSIFLFLSGGLIGIAIAGTNVTIPAHYHGSIVGISVAFMGYVYLYIFEQDYSLPSSKIEKYATYQLYIITIGQVAHIAGLAIAGGYGVLRKTTNLEVPLKAKIALGLMGGGGLIAIIGGLMFVVICAKNLFFQTELKLLNNR